MISTWYGNTFNISFNELYYTLISPLKGTGGSTIIQIISGCLPSIIVLWLFMSICYFVIFQNKLIVHLTFNIHKHKHCIEKNHTRRMITSILILCISICYAYNQFRIGPYIKAMLNETHIYEDYYVNPNDVVISNDGTKKNIIRVYLESMETTYASDAEGGNQGLNNYIPNLTKMAADNVSFSDSNNLGGFLSTTGTGWTIAALFASTAGLPYCFPAKNNIETHENFAENTVTLGDILEKQGYNQEFMCGSDATFSGKSSYYIQHGNFNIFDYYSAEENGYIPDGYHVWWGLEDSKLYGMAKDEIIKMADSSKPFDFTFLTVDTHHVGGYVCDECPNKYDVPLANVLSCADRQISEFVDWCKQQDFYDNTVIVITGDHPRMDDVLVTGIEPKDRTVYNCIINSDAEVMSNKYNRVFTTMDMFPTTLAAMGYKIDGNQLGLGVNLFSDTPTLAEKLGYDYFDDEVSKYSKYYLDNFS